MKNRLFTKVFLVSILAGSAISVLGQRTSNSISGFVLDSKSKVGVPDVYVELLNDVYATLKRVKTDGTGRYFFTGMSSGRFIIKVLPIATNYAEENVEVEVLNLRLGGLITSDNVYKDIYLKPDKRKINTEETGTIGTVFVQNVPSEAQNLYKKALGQFGNEKDAVIGMQNLKKAIEIFPEYYDALNRLGIEHIRRDQFYESLPYLVKAVQVNNRSFSSFYSLGIAAYNLKQMKEAEQAFRLTTTISPQLPLAQLQYGKVLRINGNYKEAEKVLLKASDLAKNDSMSEIHWQLGLLYEKTQRFNEAANQLELYLKIEKEDPNSQQIKNLINKFREKAKEQIK